MDIHRYLASNPLIRYLAVDRFRDVPPTNLPRTILFRAIIFISDSRPAPLPNITPIVENLGINCTLRRFLNDRIILDGIRKLECRLQSAVLAE